MCLSVWDLKSYGLEHPTPDIRNCVLAVLLPVRRDGFSTLRMKRLTGTGYIAQDRQTNVGAGLRTALEELIVTQDGQLPDATKEMILKRI